MVQGMKFLSKKGFNPSNMSNQKRVWEREQRAKQEAERLKQREIQLRREREDQELAEARGDAARNSVGFLYKAPPGMADEKKGPSESAGNQTVDFSSSTITASKMPQELMFERQPGDDDAAAAFRQLLASTSASTHEASTSHSASSHFNQTSATGSSFGVVLQGATETSEGDEPDSKQPAKRSALSTLEKAVGRKNNAAVAAGTTLEEQIQRFPALANAPREKGLDASKVGVNFKPLGAQIRNVRCFVCGTWGHSKGDRECPKSGWNPFASSSLSTAAAANTNTTTNETQHKPSSRAEEQEDRSSRRPDDSDRRRRRRRREYDDGDSSVSSYSSYSSYDSRDSYRSRKPSRRHRRNYNSEEEDLRRRRHKRSRRDDERRHKKKKRKHRKKESRRGEERHERRAKDQR